MKFGSYYMKEIFIHLRYIFLLQLTIIAFSSLRFDREAGLSFKICRILIFCPHNNGKANQLFSYERSSIEYESEVIQLFK